MISQRYATAFNKNFLKPTLPISWKVCPRQASTQGRENLEVDKKELF